MQVNVIVNAPSVEEAKQYVQSGIDIAIDAADPMDEADELGVQSASIGEIEVV